MALVGNLRDFGLSDFLYLVDRGYKTGRLVLKRPGDEAFLYFQNGKLVYATHNQPDVRLEGNVHCAPGFRDHPKVLDGASDLMIAVFGDRGLHTRTALGISDMPLNACVQISFWAEV